MLNVIRVTNLVVTSLAFAKLMHLRETSRILLKLMQNVAMK